MKTKVLFPVLCAARYLRATRSFHALAALAAAFCVSSCLVPVPAVVEPAVLRLGLAETRATADPFNTGDYILSLTSSSGKTVFRGLWKESPDEFELAPDSYAISMLSSTFKEPSV